MVNPLLNFSPDGALGGGGRGGASQMILRLNMMISCDLQLAKKSVPGKQQYLVFATSNRKAVYSHMKVFLFSLSGRFEERGREGS